MRSIIWKQYGSSEGQSKVARLESTFKKDCCWHVVMAQQLAVGGVSLVVLGVRKSLSNEGGKCCWNDFCVVCFVYILLFLLH